MLTLKKNSTKKHTNKTPVCRFTSIWRYWIMTVLSQAKAQAVAADSVPTSSMTFTWPHADTDEGTCSAENQPKQQKVKFSFGPVPSLNSTSSLPSLNGSRTWLGWGETLSAAVYTWIDLKQMWDCSLNGSKRKVHTIPTLPPAPLLLLPALAAPPLDKCAYTKLWLITV